MQLNDEENMRVTRMQRARAAVEDNPDLSPYERRELITQIETGLNPLENRQREAQILETNLRSRAMAQETEQRATLFNQHQERLAMGGQGRLQVFTDPLTNRPQLFMMGLNGEWTPMDFSQAQEHHELQMQAGQLGLAQGQQNMAIQGAMAPGQYEAQQLANERSRVLMQHAMTLQPHELEHARLTNVLLAQQAQQNPEIFRLNQLTGYTHLAGLEQALEERIQQQPDNLNLLHARVNLLQTQAQNEPMNQALAQRLERARAAALELANKQQPALAQAHAQDHYTTALNTASRHYEDQARQDLRHFQEQMNHWQQLPEILRWNRQPTPQEPPPVPRPAAPRWLSDAAQQGPIDPEVALRNYAQAAAAQHLAAAGIRPPVQRTQPPGQPQPQPRPNGVGPGGQAAPGGGQVQPPAGQPAGPSAAQRGLQIYRDRVRNNVALQNGPPANWVRVNNALNEAERLLAWANGDPARLTPADRARYLELQQIIDQTLQQGQGQQPGAAPSPQGWMGGNMPAI